MPFLIQTDSHIREPAGIIRQCRSTSASRMGRLPDRRSLRAPLQFASLMLKFGYRLERPKWLAISVSKMDLVLHSWGVRAPFWRADRLGDYRRPSKGRSTPSMDTLELRSTNESLPEVVMFELMTVIVEPVMRAIPFF